MNRPNCVVRRQTCFSTNRKGCISHVSSDEEVFRSLWKKKWKYHYQFTSTMCIFSLTTKRMYLCIWVSLHFSMTVHRIWWMYSWGTKEMQCWAWRFFNSVCTKHLAFKSCNRALYLFKLPESRHNISDTCTTCGKHQKCGHRIIKPLTAALCKFVTTLVCHY